MSKFNFEYMSDEYTSIGVFNKNKWTKQKALEQARIELVGLGVDVENLEVVEGFVRHGFYKSQDGDVYNGWYCDSLENTTIIEARNKVAVWIVKEIEDDK